jgi:hypothetical protein
MTTSTEILPVPPGWPEAPAPAAYHGLAGDIVNTIAPHTEADPVAVLVQLLVACGALIGRGAWFRAADMRHYPNEFMVLVGDSSRSRKGVSFGHVEQLLREVDSDFPSRISSGLVSGEGLVWALRDPDGSDAEARDPRMLLVEPCFDSVLEVSGRKESTLSGVLRQAWHGEPLVTCTAPERASKGHVALIGHITPAALRHHTTTLALADGLLNRFLVVACRRTRLLPNGGDQDPLGETGLKDRLAAALEHARGAGQLRLHASAKEQWRSTYRELSKPREGLVGALTAWAEDHTIRLALIYALLDGASSIELDHLNAALALWEYAASSAAWALGDSTDRHKIPTDSEISTDSEIPALTQQAA